MTSEQFIFIKGASYEPGWLGSPGLVGSHLISTISFEKMCSFERANQSGFDSWDVSNRDRQIFPSEQFSQGSRDKNYVFWHTA